MMRTRLTPAEERVARLVAEGRPTPHVAQLLGVSPKTVESHLFRVYRKLGIRSRDQLARHFEPAAPLGRIGRENEPGSPFSDRARRANLSVGVGDTQRVSRDDVDSAHLEEER